MVKSEPDLKQPTASQNGTSTKDDSFEASFKVKDEDLIRGTTPDDLDIRCLELCRTYIGGSWSNAISVADITVTRISGGLTNQLYKVHLNDNVKRISNEIYPDEPSNVAIKLYETKHFKNFADDESERLNDNILLTIMSETGIGPKVFGIFNDGVILAYHEHEQFRAKHQKNPKQLREFASILARTHHLSVPIRKTPYMLNSIETMIHYGYDKLQAGELAEQLQLKCFLAKDVRDEFKDLFRHISEVNSPVVFCHNDFRGGNILVTEPDKKIIVIDLEYCGYGPRGYDFGTYLTEWDKTTFLEQVSYLVPDESAIEELVGYYIEACNELVPGYSSKPENSLKQIVREAKLFYLVQHMFFIGAMLKKEISFVPSLPYDPIIKMKSIEGIYQRYNQIKDALFQDQTLKKLD